MSPAYGRGLAFASDNTAGAAPEAMAALAAANEHRHASYGTDLVTAEAAELICDLLGRPAQVYFVVSGTAANALALGALCRPHEAYICHEHAHTRTDEAGAPGFLGGGLGVVPLAGDHGRIDPAALTAAVSVCDASHRQSPAALSLTNATEMGTIYDTAAWRRLVATAKARGLLVHLDGARLPNAAAAGFDLRAVGAAGADVAVLGGAKAGMLPSEAIVIFEPTVARRFDARLKQAGHLPSKGWMLAAPWLGMLPRGDWVRRAANANAMAAELARRMPFPLRHPVETNAVFVDMTPAQHVAIMNAGWTVYRLADGAVRFMCSWRTDEEEVRELVADLERAADARPGVA